MNTLDAPAPIGHRLFDTVQLCEDARYEVAEAKIGLDGMITVRDYQAKEEEARKLGITIEPTSEDDEPTPEELLFEEAQDAQIELDQKIIELFGEVHGYRLADASDGGIALSLYAETVDGPQKVTDLTASSYDDTTTMVKWQFGERGTPPVFEPCDSIDAEIMSDAVTRLAEVMQKLSRSSTSDAPS